MNSIDHVVIKNFRAIQNIEFSPKPLNIFVGRNNCGKSSILQALALNLSGPSNFFDAAGNNIWADLISAKNYNVNFLPFNGTNQVTIDCKINEHQQKSTIELLNDGYPDDERGSIIQTYIQKKVDEFLQKESTISQIKETYFSFGKKGETRQLTFEGISSGSGYHEDIEESQISESPNDLKNIYYNYLVHLKDEIIVDLSKQRKTVFSGYRDGKLEYITIAFLNAPIRRIPSERYSSSSDNLIRRFYLEFLEIRFSPRFGIIKIFNTKNNNTNGLIASLEHSIEPFDISHLHDLSIESSKINKTIENLREKITYFQDIRKTDHGLQIFVTGHNNPLPLSSMGDGFNSLLKLTFMNNLLDNGIIILEEPESSLHPGFLFILCEAIMNNSEGSQFFISTHSLDFIKTILKVAEWCNKLDNIQIIRMHSQPDIQNLELEMIPGICAKDEMENIGRDLPGDINMKCLICEGKNDLIFFEQALSNTFQKKNFPVHNSMDEFYNLFRSKFHPFYTEHHDCVIYGEGGKRKLFVNVMIPLIKEVFGRQDFNKQDHHRFFVVIDADGENPSKLCNNYYEVIDHTIKSKKINRFSCKVTGDKTCFDFFSSNDSRCRCFVKTSHIPISLEWELIIKGCDRKIQNNRERVFTDLRSMPVHDALENLASRLELSVKQLIQMSVNEGWFENDSWYQEINHNLESYFFN